MRQPKSFPPEQPDLAEWLRQGLSEAAARRALAEREASTRLAPHLPSPFLRHVRTARVFCRWYIQPGGPWCSLASLLRDANAWATCSGFPEIPPRALMWALREAGIPERTIRGRKHVLAHLRGDLP